MANNKVQLSDGTVLLDLTGDTVTPETLLSGVTAHDAAGNRIVGTAVGIKLTGIAITTPPTRTAYKAGETFDPAGMVVTATYSNGAKLTSPSYTFSPAGALTASDTAITITYTEGGVTKTATQSITVRTFSIYGVSWDGTSTTLLSRTDDAAGFTNPVAYMSGISNYGSPFDAKLPWSGMTVVDDAEAGKLVKIPKFWYKLTQSGNGLKIQIADAAQDGFSVSPAHMDRGDGKGERDVVYIGRYHCRSSDYKSYGGSAPKNNITRSTARSGIHALGSTVWQSDFLMAFTIWLLYIVEYANWNSQAVIGYGCGNNSGVQSMGYTDSMPYHTGTTASARTTYGATTQYRKIEGLWENCIDWMDGCYYNSNGMMVILNPSAFSDSSGGVLVGKPSNGWISALSVKTVSGLPPLFIASGGSGSGSTYVPDNWYYDASNPCLGRGGYYGQSLDRGVFCVSYSSASDAGASIGCRLQKLP